MSKTYDFTIIPDYNYLVKRFGTEKELRKEYSRLRSVGQKRLTRLMQDPLIKDSDIVREHSSGFYYSKAIERESLAYEFTILVDFIDNPYSSLKRHKEILRKTSETFAKQGISISPDKLQDFGHYMEYIRATYEKGLYGSDQFARLYDAMEEKGIEWKDLIGDFDYWLDRINNLEKAEGPSRKVKNNAAYYRRKIQNKRPKKAKRSGL